MKSCTYCGRESADEAAHCRECGTEFAPAPFDAKPSQPRDWTWIKAACGYVAVVVVIVLLYLVSLGPVTRYSATLISQSSTTNAAGFAMQRTVRYPHWVGVVYSPAFSLTSGGNGFADLYWRYLQWWEKPQTQK